MWATNTSQTVPSLFRCFALSRACVPVVFSRTAVQFSRILSHVPSSHVLAEGTDSLQLIRSLSVSCRDGFRVTNCICVGSGHDTKTDCSADSVSAAKSTISQAQRMKRAVKEYGATVIVFHTCISLFTLGVSYAAVSR